MKTVILSHRVNDFKEWKKHYDADAARRNKAGLTELAVGTKSDDKHDVYMVWQTNNPNVMNQMLNDQDLKDAMKKAGVISEPKVIMLD
jgi:hypothetical protein